MESGNHAGRVFQLSFFKTSTADNADILTYVSAGSSYDLHMKVIQAELEGTWELAIYENPSISSNGTALTPFCTNRFTAGTSDASWYDTPTVVNTTVDAASAAGQKVLNVASTVGFETGHTICIDDGEGNNNEYKVIDTIQAGVSLTLTENLDNAYNGETVYAFGIRLAHTHAEGGSKNDAESAAAATGGEWVLKSGEKYLFRMTNRNGAAARASNILWWLEKAKQT
jgi:hypothetical protein